MFVVPTMVEIVGSSASSDTESRLAESGLGGLRGVLDGGDCLPLMTETVIGLKGLDVWPLIDFHWDMADWVEMM
jgi:hypothetical protein